MQLLAVLSILFALFSSDARLDGPSASPAPVAPVEFDSDTSTPTRTDAPAAAAADCVKYLAHGGYSCAPCSVPGACTTTAIDRVGWYDFDTWETEPGRWFAYAYFDGEFRVTCSDCD